MSGDAEAWVVLLDRLMRDRLAEDTDGCHDIGHLRRVWRNCQRIVAETPADRTILAAGAYLHDLVNLEKNAPDRAAASRRSAKAATELLEVRGFPPDKLPAVAHAIAAHSFSAKIEPETIEARILQDADRLDTLGALGIARTFYVAGRIDGRLFDADDPWARNRDGDDCRFALDHFELKLLKLPDLMQTPAGKRLAAERVRTMRVFLKALERELDG